jgi:hypothetical protein
MNLYHLVESHAKSKFLLLDEQKFRDFTLNFFLDNFVSPNYIEHALNEFQNFPKIDLYRRFRKSMRDVTVWKIKEEARKRFWIHNIKIIQKDILIYVFVTYFVDHATSNNSRSYSQIMRSFDNLFLPTQLF